MRHSVAPPPAAYHHPIRRALTVLTALGAVALAACGSQRSTLPPAPGRAGAVPLAGLARHPEVYADAQVATSGTVTPVRVHGMRRYALTGAPGARIVLEPRSAAAAYAGRRVRVSGLFTVTFELGYEILVSRITAIR